MPVVINTGTILRHTPWVSATMCIKILLAIRFRGTGQAVLMLVSSTVICYYALHNNGRQLRQFTYKVTCVARSNDVYTSSAVLTAWKRFIRIARFYGDLMSPATIKHTYVRKVPDVYDGFQRTLDFIDKFSQKLPISNHMGVRPVGGVRPMGAVLIHEDGRTDTMKL
jgi:hypothetical protein